MRLLLACGIIVACGVGARAGCNVEQRGSTAFGTSGRHLLVPLEVNGLAATFVLDTGAERSLVTPVAVQRLNLARDEWVSTRMRGVGGIVEHPNANPRSLSVAGIPLQRRTVTRDTSLTVGDLPRAMVAGRAVDGLLGRDFLTLFDLELDVATHRLTLYEVRNCAGRFAPWRSDYMAITAAMPMDRALVLPIVVNGRPLRALLDTGASASLITAPGMVRLGLTPAALTGDRGITMHGVGPQTPQTWQHRFVSWQVGPWSQRDPLLWVAPVHVVPIVDALLGADWLLAQRYVWISFATAQVFVPQP